MKQYTVIITPYAETALNELDDYITYELYAPETAIRYVDYIKSAILSLYTSPKRHPIMNDEPWHSREVRRMNIKNFAVFYFVDDKNDEVYVLDVIYQKRDIQSILLDD